MPKILSLGQKLKALRISAGLRYRDLGMHHNTIKTIETGASYNSLNKYIERLQNAAGNSIQISAGWGNKNKPAQNQENST
jgi:gamma-glutamylcysteine synthetase